MIYISNTSKSIIFLLFFEDNREQEINLQKCVYLSYILDIWYHNGTGWIQSWACLDSRPCTTVLSGSCRG